MILGISVLGMGAIMLWGAPALQIMQEQNAQAAMLGEFQEVRQNSLVLTITDSSRLPRLNLNAGDLSVTPATRMAITTVFADTTGTYPNCRMDIRDWSAADDSIATIDITDCDKTRVENPLPGCPGQAEAMCIRAYKVDGRLLTQVKAETQSVVGSGTGTLTMDLPESFATGSWLVRLENLPGTVVYAESWVIDHQALHWDMAGATEPMLRYEGGSLFSGSQGRIFIEQDAPIAEQAFGSDELALRLPLLEGPEAQRSGGQSVVVFMRLDDNILRVDDNVRAVQYDFEGTFARAWCTSLALRDDDLSAGFSYSQPYATRTCAGSTHGDGRYTMVFDRDAGATPFPFAFTHVQISIET